MEKKLRMKDLRLNEIKEEDSECESSEHEEKKDKNRTNEIEKYKEYFIQKLNVFEIYKQTFELIKTSGK